MESNNKTKSLSRNAFYNLIRQVATMLFSIILFPYVARVLGAATYGRISFADSIVGYSLLFASLGVSTYAVREGARIRDDKEKLTALASELYLINIFSLCFSLIILGISCLLFDKIRSVSYFIGIMSIGTICNILGRDWINTIYEDYRYLAIRYVAFHLLSLCLVFAFVNSEEDGLTYVLITVLTVSAAYITNFFYSKRYVSLKVSSFGNLSRHIKPILLLFSISIATRIYVYSDVTVIGFVCDSDEKIGYYTLASKIYMIIKTALIAIISVSIPRLSYYLGKDSMEDFKKTSKKIIESLFVLVIPVIVGIVTISKDIVLLVGGSEYAKAASSLTYLAFALIFSLFGCFFANAVLVPLRKEKYFMIATVITAIENLVLNVILIRILSIDGAAIATLIAEFTVASVCFYYAKEHLIRINFSVVIETMISSLSIPIICYIVKKLVPNQILSTVLCILISSVCYFTILLVMKNPIVIDGWKKIHRRFEK